MIVAFAFLGFALIAGLFVYLTVLDAAKWREKIEAVLLPIGFTVCLSKSEKAALAQALLIVNSRHQGKRLVLHLYHRPATDGRYDLFVCDYRFASINGGESGGKRILVCLVSREFDLPRLSIDCIPEAPAILGRLFHGLSETFPIPGMERVTMGDAKHDERFRLYVASGQIKQARPFLERITSTLPERACVCIDAEGDCLALSSIEMDAALIRHEFDSPKLLYLIHVTSTLFETLI
ncbi:MAG: hypothetical protein MH252_10880 [Thermosynechococcaceae cyanobacterium MS004]|nr:hypothetical protein [Thermosynechococcaceae cyanobacterium MS004]